MSTPSASHRESPTTSSATSSSFLVSLPSFARAEPLLSIGSPSIDPVALSLQHDLPSYGPSNGPYDSLNVVRGHCKKQKNFCALSCALGEHYQGTPMIKVLPDDVLLEIFDFRRWNHCIEYEHGNLRRPVWEWHILVHVCHRWRQVIFASPHRLNLQILCTNGTPVRKRLDIWPTFPIVIRYEDVDEKPAEDDNMIAALENTSRVCRFELSGLSGAQLGRIPIVMQEPFPALTHLHLSSEESDIPIFPSEFLGRSAPRLQELDLYGIPFPALPLLLPSATDLVALTLYNIPQTGYISPEAMVAGLATLTRLRDLEIGFRSPNPRPNRIRLPPATRTVLPALTYFELHGLREYLEDFVARIDAPRLDNIVMTYFNQLLDFEVPQLSSFIDRSEAFKRPMDFSVQFYDNFIFFTTRHTSDKLDSVNFSTHRMAVCIRCEGIDWQVSHLAQVLSQISIVSTYAVGVTINYYATTPVPEDMVDIEWLQLLTKFPSVRTLFVPEQFSVHVSHTLKDSARVIVPAELLPALDMLCLEGQPQWSVHKFSSTRRDSGRPVFFVNTKAEFEEIVESYEEEIREARREVS